MKKPHFLPALIIFSLLIMSVADNRSIVQQMTEKLTNYYSKFPQEKVYLHIDKNIYLPGDSLWFKAYILDYSTNKPSKISNTIFTTIVNVQGNIILEKKSLISDGMAMGDFILPDTLTEGSYTVFSYTSWMKNFDMENLCAKEIQIKPFVPKELVLGLSFYDSIYHPGEEVTAEILTHTNRNESFPKVRYKYHVKQNNNVILKRIGRTSEAGIDTIRFVLPENESNLNYTLYITAINKEDETSLVSRIPTIFSNIDLQFLPEGGDLITGLESKVAFKAVTEQGVPFDFEGELLDGNKKVLAIIKSTYKGMGVFKLAPERTSSYKVKITSPLVKNSIYELPKPLPGGYVITIEEISKENIKLRINSSDKRRKERIGILVQIRGIKYWGLDGIIKDEALMNIPTKDMPPGIAQITLFNSESSPVAERLVFVNKHKMLHINVAPLQAKYNPRGKVEISISVKDEIGNPVRAKLSLTAVDSVLCFNPKIKEPKIISSLLLASELKGTLPEPNYYFENNSPEAENALDLIMMTNGWRRFNWEQVIKQDIDKLPSPYDYDIISGTVYKSDRYWRENEPIPNAIVTITQLEPPDFVELLTDESGRFTFKLKDYDPRGIKLGLTATSSKGKKNVKIVLDEEVENTFHDDLIAFNTDNLNDLIKYNYYPYKIRQIQGKEENFIIDLGGTKLIPAVTITRKRVIKKVDPWFILAGTYPSYSKRGDELPRNTANFLQILRKVHPFLYFDYQEGLVYFKRPRSYLITSTEGRFAPMSFLINEMYFGENYHELEFLTPDGLLGTADFNYEVK